MKFECETNFRVFQVLLSNRIAEYIILQFYLGQKSLFHTRYLKHVWHIKGSNEWRLSEICLFGWAICNFFSTRSYDANHDLHNVFYLSFCWKRFFGSWWTRKYANGTIYMYILSPMLSERTTHCLSLTAKTRHCINKITGSSAVIGVPLRCHSWFVPAMSAVLIVL